jgi:hypothetical protein
MHYRIRFSGEENQHIVDNVNIYYQIPRQTFIDMYMPKKHTYEFVNEEDTADICIVGIQHEDNSLLRENEFNILFCVENQRAGRTQYRHFNKYSEFGNIMINLYINNNEIETTITPLYTVLPQIYFRINYFNQVQDQFDKYRVPFREKKFCLAASRNRLNGNKLSVVSALARYGKIDFISYFNDIHRSTCYHGEQLISLFSQYKFVVCFENSHASGYITEKIFNVFMSHSIPVYDGSTNVGDFIHPESFIPYKPNAIAKIVALANDEAAYEEMIRHPKIVLSDTHIDDYLQMVASQKIEE